MLSFMLFRIWFAIGLFLFVVLTSKALFGNLTIKKYVLTLPFLLVWPIGLFSKSGLEKLAGCLPFVEGENDEK